MKTSVKLSSGGEMPLLGLGCWQSPREQVAAAVEASILAGYRHIDTAYNYLNEDGVGDGIRAAIKTGKVHRSDLFIVTKLPMIAMHPDRVKKYLQKSLTALGLDYVDLYLVHAPVGMQERDEKDVFPMENGKVLLDPSTDLIAIWHAMEKMVKLGLAKSIGISNFNAKQILKMVSISTIKPAVLQVECHVYFQQRELREVCAKHGIAVTAYAPLGSPGRKGLDLPSLLDNPVVRLVAEKHHKTPAQALLRFLIQQDIIVIPKSTNPQRIRQNGDIFSFQLDDLDMKALESLDQDDKGRTFKYTSFPGCELHPEAPIEMCV